MCMYIKYVVYMYILITDYFKVKFLFSFALVNHFVLLVKHFIILYVSFDFSLSVNPAAGWLATRPLWQRIRRESEPSEPPP